MQQTIVKGTDVSLAQLDKTNLRERSRDSIRAAIVSGTIASGDIYPVSYFAKQLGVSATPVREALFDLVGDRLVEVVANRGFRVSSKTDVELDEILELRLMIELPATVMACEQGEFDVEALRTLAEEINNFAQKGDLISFLLTDRLFHLLVIESLHKPRLTEIIGRLRDEARLTGLEQLAESGHLESSAGEHLELIDALGARDAAATERLMRHHLQHTRGIWAGRPEGGTSLPSH